MTGTVGDARVEVEYDPESEPRRFEIEVHLPAKLSEEQVQEARTGR